MSSTIRMRSLIAASTAAVASVGIASATANAAPQPVGGPVAYQVQTSATSAVVTANRGSYTIRNGVLEFLDGAGREAASFPLAYRVNGQQFPIDAVVAGRTVTLTPSRDRGRAVAVPDVPVSAVAHFSPTQAGSALQPFGRVAADATTTRNQTAFAQLASAAAIAATLSAVTGAILAGGIGCALGLAAGGALTLGTLGVLLPATVAGCLVGAAALAPIGTLAGLIFVGAPILVGAAIQYFVTVNTPVRAAASALVPPAARDQ